MNSINKLAIKAILIIGFFTSGYAYAHGIWFAERSSQLALIYGVGGDDIDTVKRLPLVKSISAYDEDGEEVETQLNAVGPLALVDMENLPAVVAGVLDNGTWSKTPDGKWHKKARDEVPNATIATSNFKYAVHILNPPKKPIKPLAGHKLQIVPAKMKQLSKLMGQPGLMGQPLKVKVLFNGKPVAGARVIDDYVTNADGKPVMTDKKGTATIKVRNQGLNVVTAIYDAPSNTPKKSDRMELLATLSFRLPNEPE